MPFAGSRRGCYPRTGYWQIPGPKAGRDARRRYRLSVPKLILRYPDGVPGAALLLMRLSCAAIAYPALCRLSPVPGGWWPVAAPVVATILALTAGFATRIAALLLAVALVANLFTAQGMLAWLLLAATGHSLALALLGPGAWSLDAHRFGRRVIRLEPRSPDRGSPR